MNALRMQQAVRCAVERGRWGERPASAALIAWSFRGLLLWLLLTEGQKLLQRPARRYFLPRLRLSKLEVVKIEVHQAQLQCRVNDDSKVWQPKQIQAHKATPLVLHSNLNRFSACMRLGQPLARQADMHRPGRADHLQLRFWTPGACRFWKGLLAVWAGGAIGQALSFLLARYLVKDAVTYYVARKWKKWDLVELVLVCPRPQHTAPGPYT